MATITFQAHIMNGMIEIPAMYRDQFPDTIQVLVMATPVSYTHLDVYKRQSLVCCGTRDNALLGGLPPVSYTHLDVYKRQTEHTISLNAQTSQFRLVVV